MPDSRLSREEHRAIPTSERCMWCAGKGYTCECDRGESTPLNCWHCTSQIPCVACKGTGVRRAKS